MVTLHDVEQGSSGWHALRAGKYTGSTAHKLLRLGAVPEALTAPDNFHGNFWTQRGHILEHEAIELYEAITGTRVDRAGFVTNDQYPACGYSPDGLVFDPVIECKAFKRDKHLRLYNGDIPFEVMAQVQFGMLICERKLAHLIIYNPELEAKQAFKIIEIKANRKTQTNFKRILSNTKVLTYNNTFATLKTVK